MSNQTDAGGGKGHRIDIFSEFRVGDKTIQRDEPGYLVNPEDWDKAVANAIAAEEGVEMGDGHWAVITFMRDHREEHGISPDARFVFAFIAEKNGVDKKRGRGIFFELFPYGYVKQAVKIAGFPQPRAWSTG